MSQVPFRVIINCLETLIANNISKIIDPIQSRCATFKFTSIPEEDVISRLGDIAKKEKVKARQKGSQDNL